MRIDFQAHSEQTLAHYIRLGASPGWKEYVWKRVNDLARMDPTLYGELPAKVTLALRTPSDPHDLPRPSSSITAPPTNDTPAN